jgi:predicted porin
VATLAGTSALAQSSVTIYGRLNESVERQKIVDPLTGDESNLTALQNNASRIGFKGTEDLGGGLKAFFLIEHGFSPDTGRAAATFWGRESNVGLEGAFGKVRLGNMGPTAAYFATADYISMHNHDTGTSADALYLYVGDARNTIAYTTPTFSGLNAEVQIGLKETGNKNTATLAVNYVGGPLHLGASYINGADGGYGSAVTGGLLTGESAKQFGVRALYEMGPFTVGAYFINDKIDFVGGGDLKRNSYRLSGMYALGANEFHLNYGVAAKLKANGTTVDESGATQVTVAYNYNLSKRTKLFAFYSKLGGDAAPDYAVLNNGNVKSSFAAGVRHNF